MWQRRSNRRAARIKLLQIKRLSRLKPTADDVKGRDTMTESRIRFAVARNRRLFEVASGFPFEFQNDIRAALEQIVETGDRSVEDVIQSVSIGLRYGSGEWGFGVPSAHAFEPLSSNRSPTD